MAAVATINHPAWAMRLSAPPVTKHAMNQLVMDYLVIEGHKEAAERFSAESGTAVNLDLETISDRRAIRMAVESGNMKSAVALADGISPELLRGNPDLCFRVHQQQLIELIRAERLEEAITFAQQELSHRAEMSADLLAELERTMLLLAYEDVSACPDAELLSQAQRQETASLLNAAVLTAQEQEKEAALPMLLRRLHWAQDEQTQASFPRIDDYDAAQPIACDAQHQQPDRDELLDNEMNEMGA